MTNRIVAMSHDEYHAAPGVSSHKLADYRTNGPDYYYRKHIQQSIADRDSATFTFGRALHALTLEGGAAFHRGFIEAPAEHLAPSGNMSTKVATKEWVAAQAQDVITPNDAAKIRRMAEKIRDVAGNLFKVGTPEVSRFAEHSSGIAIKGRADWDAGTYGLDVKSCGSLDSFPADVRRYGYIGQGAFYRDLFSWDAFFLVAAEKDGDRVAVYRVNDVALNIASDANDAALCEIAVRIHEDDWNDDSISLIA